MMMIIIIIIIFYYYTDIGMLFINSYIGGTILIYVINALHGKHIQ